MSNSDRHPDNMRATLRQAAKLGRHGDTDIVHVNSIEEAVLRGLGGAGTRNPETGLTEYFQPGGSHPGRVGGEQAAVVKAMALGAIAAPVAPDRVAAVVAAPVGIPVRSVASKPPARPINLPVFPAVNPAAAVAPFPARPVRPVTRCRPRTRSVPTWRPLRTTSTTSATRSAKI